MTKHPSSRMKNIPPRNRPSITPLTRYHWRIWRISDVRLSAFRGCGRSGSNRIEQVASPQFSMRVSIAAANSIARLSVRYEIFRFFATCSASCLCWSALCEADPLAWFQARFINGSAAEFEKTSPKQILAMKSRCGLSTPRRFLNEFNDDFGCEIP